MLKYAFLSTIRELSLAVLFLFDPLVCRVQAEGI